MSGESTAFIAEKTDIDERGPVATGRFSGSIQTNDGEILDAIDEEMSFAEAVRWARERTDKVVIRIAGEDPSLDGELDLSRQLGRRRPSGWELLDRTAADPPIMWDVIVEGAADVPAGPVQPNGTWIGFATVPHSVVRVEAAAYEDALAAAVAGAPRGLTATRAFPTGSRAARANAHLDANGILF